jgi:hypothetical protein
MYDVPQERAFPFWQTLKRASFFTSLSISDFYLTAADYNPAFT